MRTVPGFASCRCGRSRPTESRRHDVIHAESPGLTPSTRPPKFPVRFSRALCGLTCGEGYPRRRSGTSIGGTVPMCGYGLVGVCGTSEARSHGKPGNPPGWPQHDQSKPQIVENQRLRNGGEGGIRTHVPVTRQHAFEARPLRPLRYLSALRPNLYYKHTIAWSVTFLRAGPSTTRTDIPPRYLSPFSTSNTSFDPR